MKLFLHHNFALKKKKTCELDLGLSGDFVDEIFIGEIARIQHRKRGHLERQHLCLTSTPVLIA